MERFERFTFSFADMAFGRSVVLHFPLEIQKNLGISEVAPQLLRALDAQKIDALQFLKSGRVRVTCNTAEYRDDLLEGSTFLFGDVPIPVTAADQSIRFVFVRDLPFEVPDDDVKSVFERVGVVHSISPCFFRDFPSVSNGTRRLVVSFREAIPSSVSVVGFPVGVFHAGQPVICSVCHESGHLPRACPFSGLCLCCKQPGHVVRNCVQAWGPSSSSSSPPVSTSSSVPVSTSQSASTILSRPPLCHPPCLLLCHLFSPSRKSFQKLLLKIERSPNPRRLAPLHLFRPVALLLLSSRLLLLIHLYRHPPPSHPCLAVLLLLGMRMSPFLLSFQWLVRPLPGLLCLLVTRVPHPPISRDSFVLWYLRSSLVRTYLLSKSNVSPLQSSIS